MSYNTIYKEHRPKLLSGEKSTSAIEITFLYHEEGDNLQFYQTKEYGKTKIFPKEAIDRVLSILSEYKYKDKS